jgi:hypothetical protein
MTLAEKPGQGTEGEVVETRSTAPFKYDLENGRSISIDVPISNRLAGDLAPLFPTVASVGELPLDLQRRKRYVSGIADYLDAVLRITFESQEEYRRYLDNDNDRVGDAFSFTQGDFVYVYDEDSKGPALARLTAGESGAVLLQGFSLEDDDIEAGAALFGKPDEDTPVHGSVSLNNFGTINFIEEVLSELSPGVVASFNRYPHLVPQSMRVT